ncbi:MAG: hypothetical protein WA609_12205 [Terriglobales bacterium]
MSIYLQTHTPQETAEWVRDELKIKPEDIRLWLLKPFKKRGMYSNGGKGCRFPKKRGTMEAAHERSDTSCKQ